MITYIKQVAVTDLNVVAGKVVVEVVEDTKKNFGFLRLENYFVKYYSKTRKLFSGFSAVIS